MTKYNDAPFSAPHGFYHARVWLNGRPDEPTRFGTVIAKPTTHIFRVKLDRGGEIVRVHRNNFKILQLGEAE